MPCRPSLHILIVIMTTALIYCRDITLSRLSPYMSGLASLYPVRIAVNSPVIQPSTHIVYLDKKCSGWLNAYSKTLIHNNTKIICRSNCIRRLSPELWPLIAYPFSSTETINQEYDCKNNPKLYVNMLSFMTALNVALLEGAKSAIIVGCSLTNTGHYDAPKTLFDPYFGNKIEKINSGLPYLQKFLKLYQYTELKSNLALPNITFRQLMTKSF